MTAPRRASSLKAERRFRAILSAAGATLLEPEWLGANYPHRILCSKGHAVAPRPANSLSRGDGVCIACAPSNSHRAARSVEAERRFRQQLKNAGATLLKDVWLGSDTPHRVRCKNGHVSAPRPGGVISGKRGICGPCARMPGTLARSERSIAAEESFYRSLAEYGAVSLEPWVHMQHKHRVKCRNGHATFPLPANVARGQGICRRCANKDTDNAKEQFVSCLTASGATLLEPYRGAKIPHRIRCAIGHISYPTWSNVNRGSNPCGACAGKAWDVTYVVINERAERVKYGISAGSGGMRLGDHRRAGYDKVLRLHVGLPEMKARYIEQACRRALDAANVLPVKGREYYPLGALSVVLHGYDAAMNSDVCTLYGDS